MMKTLGFILIIAGIAMFVFGRLRYTKKEKILDAGPVEVTRDRHKTIEWPDYSGGLAVVAGIALLVFDKRKK